MLGIIYTAVLFNCYWGPSRSSSIYCIAEFLPNVASDSNDCLVEKDGTHRRRWCTKQGWLGSRSMFEAFLQLADY